MNFFKKNWLFYILILICDSVSTASFEEGDVLLDSFINDVEDAMSAGSENPEVKHEINQVEPGWVRRSIDKYWFAVIWDKNSGTASVKYDNFDYFPGVQGTYVWSSFYVGKVLHSCVPYVKYFNADNSVHLFPASLDESCNPLVNVNGYTVFEAVAKIDTTYKSYSSEREYLAVFDLVLDNMNMDKPFFSDMAVIYEWFNSTKSGVKAKARLQLANKAKKLFLSKLNECKELFDSESNSSSRLDNVKHVLNGLKKSKSMFAKYDFSGEAQGQILNLYCAAVDAFRAYLIEKRDAEFLSQEELSVIFDEIEEFTTDFNSAASVLPNKIRPSAANYFNDSCKPAIKALVSNVSIKKRFIKALYNNSGKAWIASAVLFAAGVKLGLNIQEAREDRALISRLRDDLGLDFTNNPQGFVRFKGAFRGFINDFLGETCEIKLKTKIAKFYTEYFGESSGSDHFAKFMNILKESTKKILYEDNGRSKWRYRFHVVVLNALRFDDEIMVLGRHWTTPLFKEQLEYFRLNNIFKEEKNNWFCLHAFSTELKNAKKEYGLSLCRDYLKDFNGSKKPLAAARFHPDKVLSYNRTGISDVAVKEAQAFLNQIFKLINNIDDEKRNRVYFRNGR